jgi:hypothetical protein
MARYRSPAVDFLPNEHMRLVGIIAAHWEMLDSILERLAAEVTKNKAGRVHLLTNSMNYAAKRDLLMAYARQYKTKKPDLWKQFTTAFDAVNNAYSLRNTFVHAKWIHGPSTKRPKRTGVRTKGGKLVEFDEPTPIKDLKVAADTIITAGNDLVAVFRKVRMLKP